MVPSFHAFEYFAVIASVAAGLNRSPSSSQPKLLSTATSARSLAWSSDEAFAIYELSLAFPDLSTLQGRYNRVPENDTYFFMMLDSVTACFHTLRLLRARIVSDDAGAKSLHFTWHLHNSRTKRSVKRCISPTVEGSGK